MRTKNLAQSILFLAFGPFYSPHINAVNNKPIKPLTPQVLQIDKTNLPSISDHYVLHHRNVHRLVSEQIKKSAQVIIYAGDGRKYLTHNESLHINGNHERQKWGIYRVVTNFSRKNTSEKMVLLRLLGLAELISTTDNSSSLDIVMQYQEITQTDIALPLPTINHCDTSKFTPLGSIPNNLRVTILGGASEQKYSATNQVVILDRGEVDGLRCAEELAVFEPSIQSKWTLPNIEIGRIQVFQTYPFFSLALITQSSTTVRSGNFAKPLSEWRDK